MTTTNAPSPQTAYILNIILPGAGNIYFGQPIIGTLFILAILLGLFMLFFGASAAMLGILIIIISVVAAFFTLGLSLVIGLPVGLIFLMMGAGPIVAFFIWIFSLIVSEILVHSKASKLPVAAYSSVIQTAGTAGPIQPPPPAPRSSSSAAPAISIYRRGASTHLYRKVVLNTRPIGDFGPVNSDLTPIRYARDTQNRVFLTVASQQPCALRRGGRQQSLSEQAKNSLAFLPGDVLLFGEWEIAFDQA